MKYTILTLALLIFSFPATAQERGLLASILNDSCEKYIEGTETNAYEYETFCSGYFESVLEHKAFVEKKNIFDCFPTYGDYDPFKKLVIQNFMAKFDQQQSKDNQYVRSFDLARESIDELFSAKCKK